MLARLALAAVCRLTPLSPEEVADLKLAVTEAAADFVDEEAADTEEARVDFAFRLEEDRLVLELEGAARSPRRSSRSSAGRSSRRPSTSATSRRGAPGS